MAFGFGMLLAASCQSRLNSLSSIAFIGLPCPMNKAGMIGLDIRFSISNVHRNQNALMYYRMAPKARNPTFMKITCLI